MEKQCVCGIKIIKIKPSRYERTKFCSRKCKDSNIIRPSGLKYNLVKINPTSFKKGQNAWNKGIREEKSSSWKGDNVGYSGIHDWVERKLGKPRLCEQCGTKSAKKYDWSNKSGEYKRDLSDWQRLCVRCHFIYDREKFGTRKNFHR